MTPKPAILATGLQAIELAAAGNIILCKYADPVEGERIGLTVGEALDVASQDPSLIYATSEA